MVPHNFDKRLILRQYNREQQKGKTFKYGEGKFHYNARERFTWILKSRGWTVQPNAKLVVSWFFMDAPRLQTYNHEYDTYAEKKHDNGLTSQLIVEYDGSRRHGGKEQKKRDIVAENYAAFFLPDARLIRIPISDLLDYKTSDDTIAATYGIK